MVNFKSFPIRWFGYGIAIGEAVRGFINTQVMDILFTITAFFIGAHILSDAINAGNKAPIVAVDTLIFELFASALIPPFLVYWIVRITADVLHNLNVPYGLERYLPVVFGILAISYCAEYLDKAVDNVMSQTVRTIYP